MSSDNIQKNEIGGACSTCGERRRRVAQKAFVWQNRTLGLRKVCVHGRIIFKLVFIKQEEVLIGLIRLRIGRGVGLL